MISKWIYGVWEFYVMNYAKVKYIDEKVSFFFIGQPPFVHESTSETYLNIINVV